MEDSKSEMNESEQNLMEVSPGAATASEIFRHLQATHGKEEITTELAKILSVLHTTLKEEDSSGSSSNSGSDSESRSSTDDEPEQKADPPKTSLTAKPNSALNPQKPAQSVQQANAPLGKPPKYPSFRTRTLGPDIEDRIRELSAPKQGRSGKEEMQILSKILVTLLCSCRSTAATAELKKIIRHFKEAASEAGDEFGTDDVDFKSSNGSSSNGRSKRKKSRRRRRRWSSGQTSSHSSHGSEADSQTNTLTPCNTDSKSSGTDDERENVPQTASNPGKGADPLVSTRLRFNVVVEDPPVNANGKVNPETNVSFTISLPRRSSIEMSAEASYNCCNNFHSISQVEETNKEEFYDDEEEEEEEWEWEEDEDTGKFFILLNFLFLKK